ncbi:unnamed protein product [Arctia plantaginis]|uniref:Enhancer of mRNA-decapping protein 4 C-terminal domain-containing protein n=1 Tax=Arctia plantaginis TaxID=874455 RepID=A0A8S1APA2_ARCPL|nr:unnamed protein product [Arctia plantaginis]
MDTLKQDYIGKTIRPRSHSLCSLQSEENALDQKLYRNTCLHRTYSDSSIEFCMHSDTEEYKPLDSGICDRMSDADMFAVLEQKIDRLSDMFLDQCRLLNVMKDEIRSSKIIIRQSQNVHNSVVVDVMKKVVSKNVPSTRTNKTVQSHQIQVHTYFYKKTLPMDTLKRDYIGKTVRPRSHSLCSLQSEENALDQKLYRNTCLHRTYSDSSIEFCMHSDTEEYKPLDSGICDRMSDADMFAVLEQKIDRLSDMFLDQCRLLNVMKDEIRSSKMIIRQSENVHNSVVVDVMKKVMYQRAKEVGFPEESTDEDSDVMNCRAKCLLNAIETRKEVSLDNEIKENLISFLQSEELKDQMVRTTAESVRSMIGGCFSRDMSTLYLPILDRSHRRLISHIHKIIEQAFLEQMHYNSSSMATVEDKSSSLFKSVHKTSGALRRALERHQCLLEAACDPDKNIVSTLQCTVEELLQDELKDWRQKVFDIFSTQIHTEALPEQEMVPPIDYIPVSTPQPADPEVSAIDQLTALINKLIQSGDMNGSFERALSAADLSLVMAACRAADPDLVFAVPCKLEQYVLLSLIQQLATDMLHETQLKCRYLEDAIIHLNTADPDTRAHLPLVVGEVRKHLSKFLTEYPHHVANRRITLIVMAANNLLK